MIIGKILIAMGFLSFLFTFILFSLSIAAENDKLKPENYLLKQENACLKLGGHMIATPNDSPVCVNSNNQLLEVK